MIKAQIGVCKKKYDDRLEIGKKYLLYPSKNGGTVTAYLDEKTSIPILQTSFITTSVPYYQMFFEITKEFELKNRNELKKIKKIEIEKIEEEMK